MLKFKRVGRLWNWWQERNRALLPILFADDLPLDLRFVGRTILRVVIIGVACGLVGAAFFGALEWVQRVVLEELCGYVPLRAHGEHVIGPTLRPAFRPWLLLFIPAAGGLVCGWLTRYAPEASGGGGDFMIEAFHHRAGLIRRRAIPVKFFASIASLGTGGSGGREGPTMMIGGAIGSAVARLLAVGARERRVLLVAGVAAGIAAVFRTPLGAALLAVEVLYKDGFESDALIPAVLASVVAYSIVILIFGESTLLAHAPRFPFVPEHLPLYALLALFVASLAWLFVRTLRAVRARFARLSVPPWVRPGIGGLALGIFSVPLIMFVGARLDMPGQGLGILGGGYGAAQAAISGAPWLPAGWWGVLLLAALAGTKLLSASLTIGSGGSAGDFAPSLAIGGVAGGAFGRAAQLLINDPRIDPGAFALVGMGAFYGGVAHVPLASLVLVCEMAGNYDLFVPLMMGLGISYVALRKTTLYAAQVASPRESPTYRDSMLRDLLAGLHVRDVLPRQTEVVAFEPRASATEMLAKASETEGLDVYPVVDGEGHCLGLVRSAALRVLARERQDAIWVLAADLMEPAVTVGPDDDLRTAIERMVKNRLRALPVIDADNKVVAVVDETDLTRMQLNAAARAEDTLSPDSRPPRA